MAPGGGDLIAICAAGPVPIVRALFLVLLLVASARAGDRCLGGAFRLGDQRALAALRADMDAACPCADAGSRRGWRRCARGRTDAALDAGALRRECRKAVLADVKGAVCGTAVP